MPVVEGDAVTGAGLDAALEGVECAYFLIHSMETAGTANGGDFAERDRARRERVRRARRAAPACGASSTSAASCPADAAAVAPPRQPARGRARSCSTAAPEAVAFRASIVIAAASRSFRFLVRLVERLPVLALPAWREHRTQPIDGRDVIEFLARAAGARPAWRAGRSTSPAPTWSPTPR